MTSPRPVFHYLTLFACSLILAAPELPAADLDLSLEQEARLRQYIPRVYAKLLRRQPVHTVLAGDSIMNNLGYDQDSGNALKAWPGIFLQEIADQFLYTGGVRLVRPPRGQPEKLLPVHGPEITVQNFSRNGRRIVDGLEALRTYGFENRPDLVVVGYGVNDAVSQLPLELYRQTVLDIVELAAAQKADLILCGPTVMLSEIPEEGLALTRPYADVMRQVAEASGVFYADLGDLTWLLKVDDRPSPLLPVKKPKVEEVPVLSPEEELERQKKAAKAAKTAEPTEPPPVPGALPPTIVNPVAEEYDQDPDKVAMRLFQQVVAAVKLTFHETVVPDWLHPDPATQRLLGKRVFDELVDGPTPVPWALGAAGISFTSPEKAVLTYRLANASTEEQTFTLLPLVTPMLRPADAPSRVTLAAGKKTDVTVTYTRVPPPDLHKAGRFDHFPAQTPWLSMPILITGGSLARVEVVRAPVGPVMVQWETGAQFNQTGNAALAARILNHTGQPVQGKWEASWMDQKWEGTYTVAPKGESPVSLALRLPPPNTPGRMKGTLSFTLNTGATSIQFDREVELVRNIGLKEPVALFGALGYPRDKVVAPPEPSPAVPSVSFRADADKDTLYFTWDIFGLNLQDNPAGGPAVTADVILDARSYGKRLTPGNSDAIRITSAAADGEGKVSPLVPWVFGTGYAMEYDEKAIKARLSSRPDGSRRLTMALPRSYLYLHEFALGNGNSQIGLSTYLSVWQRGDEANPGGTTALYGLTHNAVHRDRAESHSVLELAEPATGRWTVRLY